MNIRFLIRFCIFIAICMPHAQAQQTEWLNEKPWISGNFIQFEIDELNQIYLLEASGRLIQYNEKGDSMSVYNDIKRFGVPNRLDVANPLRPLLFFPTYGTMVILDRLLTYRGSVNFRKLQQVQVSFAINAYDGNFWIYDEQEFKIKKINTDGIVQTESADLRLQLQEAPHPTSMFESDQHLVLYDIEKGFYLFDLYGGFIKHWPYKKWKMLQASKNKIAGISAENELCFLQWNTPVPNCKSIELNISDILSFRRTNQEEFVLTKRGLFRRNFLIPKEQIVD
jgi:hypothetical protein